MIEAVVKSFLIGILASAPLGPVVMMVLQKSLCQGRKAGFSSGLGSAAVDTLYAAISLFAISYAEKFLSDNKLLISLLGGIIITSLGVLMIFRNPFKLNSRRENCIDKHSARNFVQAAVAALSNPGAILLMFGLMAVLRLEATGAVALCAVFSVFLGASSFWFALSYFVSKGRNRLEPSTLSLLNRVLGIIVVALGLFLIVNGII